MATWIFEPEHTGAEFRVRHMMVTWVRGMFKDSHGKLEFDPDRWLEATFDGEIDATTRIERHEFGVSWQDVIPGGGVVVGNQIGVILDVEAVLLADLQRTGAISTTEV